MHWDVWYKSSIAKNIDKIKENACFFEFLIIIKFFKRKRERENENLNLIKIPTQNLLKIFRKTSWFFRYFSIQNSR